MTGQADRRARPARKTVKAPDAFRTISEVSEELDLPQHVLRFWETRFTHIRPLKRGGGRRLYRPDHVALLRGIRALLYDDGMTIRGARKILRERGARDVIARGAGDRLPEISSGETGKRPAGPGKPGDALGRGASEPGGPEARRAAPVKIRESIRRLEDVLARLERA